MTIPTERTRAVQWANDLLVRLLDKKATPRVPETVREEARRILRHYPNDFDLHLAAQSAPQTWSDPENPEAHGFKAAAPEQTGTYLLRLTEAQAQTLVAACDLYSRIGIGQFEEVARLASMGVLTHKDKADGATADDVDAAESALMTAKQQLTGLPSNASFGIHNDKVRPTFKLAWDLQQVIRHRLSWDRRGNPAKREWSGPDSMMGVNFDEPHASAEHPLAKMEKASEVDMLAQLPAGFAMAKSGFGGDQEWHLLKIPQGANAKPEWLASGESVRAMLAVAADLDAGRPVVEGA
jgi:hypothetical protein